MPRVCVVANGIRTQSKTDFCVWLDKNLGDFDLKQLSSESYLITTENVNCAKSLCKKKDIRVGASKINFSSISSPVIHSHNMEGISTRVNDNERDSSLASTYDFKEDESTQENANDARVVQSARVDMKENFEIPSAKFHLLKKHNFLESLKANNLGGTCRIIENQIELTGSQEIINIYKIQIYDWLKKTFEVHIDVQKMPKLLSISSRILEHINKSLKFLHVQKCSDHMPESCNECFALFFYNSTKEEAFKLFSDMLDKHLHTKSFVVQQKVMEYLEKELNPKIEDILKKYKDLDHDKGTVEPSFTTWTFIYYGNRDYFEEASNKFGDLVRSIKVKRFALERSKSSPTLQTYISGVMNEDHVHIHSYNCLDTRQGESEERAMINGMVVSVAHGHAPDQDVDATFISSFNLERGGISIYIKHNNSYICFATGFLVKEALGKDLQLSSLCEEKLLNSTLNEEEMPKNTRVKTLLNYVMDNVKEQGINSMAVTPSGFGTLNLFFEMCEMISKRFRNIKLFSTDEQEVKGYQSKLHALVSSPLSPWTKAEGLEFQVIGPDEERVKEAEKKLTNFFA